jgi:hypothetical protein
MTDSSTVLAGTLKDRKHDQVNHKAGEYVRYEDGICITTNAIEGSFATLKRGINGVYHHVGKSTCTGIFPSLIFATTPAR